MVELNATRRLSRPARSTHQRRLRPRQANENAATPACGGRGAPIFAIALFALPHRSPQRSRSPIRKPCALAAKSGRTNAAEPWPVSLPGTQEKTSPRSALDTSSGIRPGNADHLRKVSLGLSAMWNGAEQNCRSNCLGGITALAPGIRERNFSRRNRAKG